MSFREKTEEKTLRVELRRDMSETVNGSIGYAHSKRTGSEWQTTVPRHSAGQLGSNLVHPLHLADRDRDKLRATVGWTPLDKLDLSEGRGSRTNTAAARSACRTAAPSFSASTAPIASARPGRSRPGFPATTPGRSSCRANAASNNNGDITRCNNAANPIWSANMRNVGTAFGLGVKGKATAQLEVGAELQFSNDRAEFRNSPTPSRRRHAAARRELRPPVAKVTAKYAMQKNIGVRLQYIHDRFSTNDWTWDQWTYSDGTRVLANSQQAVNFLGVSYYYKFQ